MKDYSNLRVASVQISYELKKDINIFRVKCDDSYKSKIKSILQYLKGKVDVVVFPELSIPFEMLHQLKEYAINSRMLIIAGSHYVENKNLDEYKSFFEHNFQDGDLRKNICPVILPDGRIFHIEKINPSKDEAGVFDEVGMTPGNIQAIFNIGNYNVGIMICSDFLNGDLRNRITTKCHLLIVPQYNYRMERFYRIAELEFFSPNDNLKCILLSNSNIKSAGSAIFKNLSKSDQESRKKKYEYNYAALITDDKIEEDFVILSVINLKSNSERTTNVYSKNKHPVDYKCVSILKKNETLSDFKKSVSEAKDRESCLGVIRENRDLLKESSSLLPDSADDLRKSELNLNEIKRKFEMILV